MKGKCANVLVLVKHQGVINVEEIGSVVRITALVGSADVVVLFNVVKVSWDGLGTLAHFASYRDHRWWTQLGREVEGT